MEGGFPGPDQRDDAGRTEAGGEVETLARGDGGPGGDNIILGRPRLRMWSRANKKGIRVMTHLLTDSWSRGAWMRGCRKLLIAGACVPAIAGDEPFRVGRRCGKWNAGIIPDFVGGVVAKDVSEWRLKRGHVIPTALRKVLLNSPAA